MQSMPSGPQASLRTPVAAGERIESLDLLRGVAVLGILVMNIYAFAMPFPAYTNPFVMGGTEPWNLATWVLTHIFFDQKFMTIFSMLFGAGIVLMMDRARARGASFGPLFFRRQFWLLVIALMHGYLLWGGDILFFYSVVGVLAYLFRESPPRKLVVIAILILPIPLVMNYGASLYVEQLMVESARIEAEVAAGGEITDEQQATLDAWRESRGFLAPTDEDVQEELDLYAGSYLEILRGRAPELFGMQLAALPFFVLWRVLAMMLLGMALMKLGVLSGERPGRFYRRLALVAYGLGLPLTVLSAWGYFSHDFDPIWNLTVGAIPNYYGSILVALGHIALVMLLVQSGLARGLVRRLEAVGRMALSNYLMHSIVMTSIFYGYGLGLYGGISRSAQMLFVAGMLAVQLLVSPWWLSRYRFGPAEWLWRSLTYGRLQPMRAR